MEGFSLRIVSLMGSKVQRCFLLIKYEAHGIKRESDFEGKNVDNVTHKIKILGHFFLYVSMLIDQKKN